MSNHNSSVGDKFYLKTKGDPIGLELTGAIARVNKFMGQERIYSDGPLVFWWPLSTGG